MERTFPVYTTANECQDCYKCVRHCFAKAIRIDLGRATIIPELCVSCGECVKVCPAHAKKIRSDCERAKFLLAGGAKLYASIAPSFVGYFRDVPLATLAGALVRLGFTGVSETALGAQLVSAETGKFLRTADPGVYISSACPAVVDYIAKYQPDWMDAVVPVVSPVIAHARLLHKHYGNDAKVVFIGPCAAKKNEADHRPDDLALAITFTELENWLEEAGVEFKHVTPVAPVPAAAEEGRCYSLEGGMNDTLRDPGSRTRYLAVSGIEGLARMLARTDRAALSRSGGKLFIEALACAGGCVNGPAMPRTGANLETLLRTATLAGADRTSIDREVPVAVANSFDAPVPAAAQAAAISEDRLRKALASTGKFTLADELNCGGCGYNTCREFARAQLVGKAEASMCLSYLRKMSQKTSAALIKYIPVGVVLVDKNLQIIECNRPFAEICGAETLETFNLCGNLNGAFLQTLSPFADLFESVLANGGELERFNQMHGERIFNLSVFAIGPGETAGAVIQDVTTSELRREQVAEKAREVIRKNVMTVQTIARYLGEHMADTEILLNEVAGAYSKPTGNGELKP